MSMPCTPLSQRDPRWSKVMLGTTGRTIGSDGCLLTALTSKLQYHGIMVMPQDTVGRLKDKGGIAQSGDTSWPSITAAFPNVLFRWRWSTTLEERGNVAFRLAPLEAYRRILKLLVLGQPTLIRTEKNGLGHWVLAVDGEGTDDLIIMDPWDGQIRRFTEKYGSIEDNLYAYGVLIGSPNGTADRAPEETKKSVILGAGAALHATLRGDAKEQIADMIL